MTPEEQIRDLLTRYREGRLTPEEKRKLDAWYNQYASDSDQRISEKDLDAVIRSMADKLPLEMPKVRQLWPRIAAAASIIVILSVSGYFLLHRTQNTEINAHKVAQQDILPGGNKAILTLANGQMISLSQKKSGIIANQLQTQITKTEDGKIVYSAANTPDAQIQYNTISTPRGGQWPELVLPDGTKVRLDAASSIRYPVAFNGKERLVEITGQVYFEVVHNEKLPFRVKAGDQIIEDVGTVFNINAYADEPQLKTTLVSGAVRVSGYNKSVLLHPGQQAYTSKSEQAIRVQSVNTSDELAWLKGQIALKGQNLEQVMRQASRWYDVDIVYEGTPPNRVFAGSISRNVKLNDLLKALSFYDIHFDVNGKTITVRPQ